MFKSGVRENGSTRSLRQYYSLQLGESEFAYKMTGLVNLFGAEIIIIFTRRTSLRHPGELHVLHDMAYPSAFRVFYFHVRFLYYI